MAAHVGMLLRHVRQTTGLSQLELAFRLNVSQRHISFIEGGRARPSRELIENWSRETHASISLRNAALRQAGYAPSGDDLLFSDPRLAAGIEALQRMLALHEPYAGVVFDSNWNARFTNSSARWLIAQLLPGFIATLGDPDECFDMIEALSHEQGLLSTMREPWRGGGALLDQLRAEQWANPALKPRVDELESSITRRFGPRHFDINRDASEPFLNLEFDTPIGLLRFFTLQSVFALPQDVTLASLRMELWFPSDEATREVMHDKPSQEMVCKLAVS